MLQLTWPARAIRVCMKKHDCSTAASLLPELSRMTAQGLQTLWAPIAIIAEILIYRRLSYIVIGKSRISFRSHFLTKTFASLLIHETANQKAISIFDINTDFNSSSQKRRKAANTCIICDRSRIKPYLPRSHSCSCRCLLSYHQSFLF